MKLSIRSIMCYITPLDYINERNVSGYPLLISIRSGVRISRGLLTSGRVCVLGNMASQIEPHICTGMLVVVGTHTVHCTLYTVHCIL